MKNKMEARQKKRKKKRELLAIKIVS